MKNFLFLLIVLSVAARAYSQQKADSNYGTSIVSAGWMPSGQSILVAVVKFHKTDNNAPFYSKVFRYDLASGKLSPVLDNASNLSVSPDGNTIAFLKRDDPKRVDVYFFDLKTKQEKLVKTDTMRKSAMTWSPDGKKFAYNTSVGTNSREAPVEIFVHDLSTGVTKQITKSQAQKNYSPAWSPDSKTIAYYVEKGDHRDQIWLTDADGSFHTNLTNDTAHSFFPTWMDNQTIIYNSSPSDVVMLRIDGRDKKIIHGIEGEGVKYNPQVKKLAYVISEGENQLIIFDWVAGTAKSVLKGTEMITSF